MTKIIHKSCVDICALLGLFAILNGVTACGLAVFTLPRGQPTGEPAKVNTVPLSIMIVCFVFCAFSTLGMLFTCCCCTSPPSAAHRQAVTALARHKDIISTAAEPSPECAVDSASMTPVDMVALLHTRNRTSVDEPPLSESNSWSTDS